MATFTIEEFRSDADLGEWPQEPPIVVQTAITTSASSQASAAFAADTRWVILSTDAPVRIRFGTNPTATSSSRYMVAGSSAPIAVLPGDKVAVINA